MKPNTRYPDLYLASKSPRRRELLSQIGVFFEVMAVDIPEHPQPGETTLEHVSRLALEKAQAGLSKLMREGKPVSAPVLGSDTLVVVGGKALGKPADQGQAVDMLLQLSGCGHQVMTGVAIVDESREQVIATVTEVKVKPISPDEAQAYWNTGEPADKAGAYGIQGYGAVFIDEIKGSYTGVVGLPLSETAELLKAFNVPVWRTG